MQFPEALPIGTRVEIIQPDYVAGQIGLILGREEVVEGEPSRRWLVRIVSEDAVLSLAREEFRILSQSNGGECD
ncbi:MAG: hypothetical protein MUF72_09425 [Elainella sp. Prado103]|nr:hypothetical protein [Elainella sp. Prado103]